MKINWANSEDTEKFNKKWAKLRNCGLIEEILDVYEAKNFFNQNPDIEFEYYLKENLLSKICLVKVSEKEIFCFGISLDGLSILPFFKLSKFLNIKI